MPINVTTGSTIEFTAVFRSSANVIFVPVSATITLTYPPSSNNLTTTSCAMAMTVTGNTFTATWGSGVSALGDVSYFVTGSSVAPSSVRQLRVIS